MVRSAGIEPTTICLEGRCSIQLSYERNEGHLTGSREGVQGLGLGAIESGLALGAVRTLESYQQQDPLHEPFQADHRLRQRQ